MYKRQLASWLPLLSWWYIDPDLKLKMWPSHKKTHKPGLKDDGNAADLQAFVCCPRVHTRNHAQTHAQAGKLSIKISCLELKVNT